MSVKRFVEIGVVRVNVNLMEGKNMRDEYDFKNAKRGAVVEPSPNKTRITIRLDADVIEHFKKQVREAGGGSYQTLISRVLQEHIEMQKEPFEQILRRVLREELAQAR